MNTMIEVVEVLHKPTGEHRFVKTDRLNPEIHEKVGEPYLTEGDHPVFKPQEKKLEMPVVKEDNVVEEQTDPELEKMTLADLKELAKEKGIKVVARDTKKTVIGKLLKD